MDNLKDRLLQVFDNQKIKIGDVVKKISVSQKYFNTKSSVGGDILEKIAENYPEINMDWVVTGRGEMLIDINSLETSTKLKKTKKFKAKDPLEMFSHELVELKAILRTVLKANGGILASQQSEDEAKIMASLSEDVQDEILSTLAEIQRRYG